MTRRARGRGGFTLVELLVVIAIIAILAAMTAGGIGRVRAAAIRAQAAAEIAQLANAVGAFKAKFNVDYLPATGPVSGSAAQKFRLRSTYTKTSNPDINSFEAKYLKSLFPQWEPAGTGTPANNGLPDLDLDHNQALVFFLSGGSVTNFTGFSPNRAAPFSSASLGSTEPRIGPFFEFPQSRIGGSPPQFRDPWGTPYAYFSSGYDPGYGNPTGASPITVTFNAGAAGDAAPLYRGHSTTPSRGRFEQAKSFQIISAGANQKFGLATGTGGVNGNWIDQVGGRASTYRPTAEGGDDLANFVGGTLGFAQ